MDEAKAQEHLDEFRAFIKKFLEPDDYVKWVLYIGDPEFEKEWFESLLNRIKRKNNGNEIKESV